MNTTEKFFNFAQNPDDLAAQNTPYSAGTETNIPTIAPYLSKLSIEGSELLTRFNGAPLNISRRNVLRDIGVLSSLLLGLAEQPNKYDVALDGEIMEGFARECKACLEYARDIIEAWKAEEEGGFEDMTKDKDLAILVGKLDRTSEMCSALIDGVCWLGFHRKESKKELNATDEKALGELKTRLPSVVKQWEKMQMELSPEQYALNRSQRVAIEEKFGGKAQSPDSSCHGRSTSEKVDFSQSDKCDGCKDTHSLYSSAATVVDNTHYEAWVLHREPSYKKDNYTITWCGIKWWIRTDSYPVEYSFEALPATQADVMSMIDSYTHKNGKPDTKIGKEDVEKRVSQLEEAGKEQILNLIRLREENTRSKDSTSEWELVAFGARELRGIFSPGENVVREEKGGKTRRTWYGKKVKSNLEQEWILILKGEMRKSGDLVVPTVYMNPWEGEDGFQKKRKVGEREMSVEEAEMRMLALTRALGGEEKIM